MNSSKDECAICLESLTAREGQALFTAECSHTFHFNCIASNVQHGNHICPTCRRQWTNLPSQFIPSSNTNNNVPDPIPPAILPRVRFSQPYSPVHNFADDEPLPSTDSSTPLPQVNSHQGGKMTVKALPEFPALSRSEQKDSFPVLIGIHAPSLSPEASDRPDARVPVDLVAVLDISGSMNGDKISLLKQAMGFVVDTLGPTDRLSVIVFSTSARRLTPLRRMTDLGRTDTIREMNSLRANGATNIISALKLAVQVLEQRTHKNPVASIVLLTDGQDNQNYSGGRFLESLARLPPCIRSNVPDQYSNDVVPVPVHSFGFGSDHDATTLHAIADGSGGTFSYIESIEIIQDAFAQCIGGLLSVVGQEVEIHVQSGPGSVQIRTISSGRYRNTIDNDGNQHGKVFIGDIYAEEEKQFLVNLSVPQEDSDNLTTKLLEVKCSYKDPISHESIISETVTVEIRRPTTEDLSEEDTQVRIEVDRERNRISIAEGIAEAQAMAERGELESARELLGRRRMAMMESDSAQLGDRFSTLLDDEVSQIQGMWSSKARYESGGRAFALSKGNAHMYQRASTQAIFGSTETEQPSRSTIVTTSLSSAAPSTRDDSGYQTSFMRKMVSKSKELRNSGGSSN